MRHGRRRKVLNGTLLLLLLPVTIWAAVHPELDFDGRNWLLGFKAYRGDCQIEEYVLYGETVLDWSEIVTWQYFPGWRERGGPAEIMRQFRHRRMQQSPTVVWEVLGSDFDSVLYTWKIENDPRICDYFELARIIETNDGVHIFRYAAKDLDAFDEYFDSWIVSFENVEIDD